MYYFGEDCAQSLQYLFISGKALNENHPTGRSYMKTLNSRHWANPLNSVPAGLSIAGK
jgi:hypothetical protein